MHGVDLLSSGQVCGSIGEAGVHLFWVMKVTHGSYIYPRAFAGRTADLLACDPAPMAALHLEHFLAGSIDVD
jgi:hypothetical protein